MDLNNLRNFKDFLGLYNRLSEICFGACVENLNARSLSTAEVSCVEKCCTKYTNMNHRIIRTYSEVQPVIQQQKVEEMEKSIREAEALALKQQEAAAALLANPPVPPPPLDFTTSIF